MFTSVYVFRTTNARSQVVHNLREAWSDSKIFFGKNKVMQVAMGRSQEEEYQENFHLLSARLVGPCMVLFTNRARGEVEDFFNSIHEKDYARMGMIMTRDVSLEKGPLEQ